MSYYRQGPHRSWGGGGLRIGTPELTPMVRAIIIACTAVWVLQFALYLADFAIEPWLGLVPFAVFHGFVWQPLTYMFLHQASDPFHLLFNMLMLWMFGGELERFWGSRRFLRFYLICGLGAGLITVLFNGLVLPRAARLATVGASGAIYGLFVAYGVIFAERIVLFMMLFPMRARTMAWVMMAVTFCSTLAQPLGGVAHIAHLGGGLVGYLLVKRAWRLRELWASLRWSLRRRRFKVMPRSGFDDRDRWVN